MMKPRRALPATHPFGTGREEKPGKICSKHPLRQAGSPQPPLTDERGVVNADLLQLLPILGEWVQEGDLRGIVGVGAEDHRAVLPVKGEVGDLPPPK